MLKNLRNEGVNITRPAALKLLREHNLEPYTGLSLKGERARLWRKCNEIETSEDADENEDVVESDAPDDTTKSSKVESEISRVNASNEELLTEKQNLFDLVQKSVALKREIRAQQKQLLLEMSQLVQAMYGDSDAD
jgi:flagellar motility protein MotE (MotC chaperone)